VFVETFESLVSSDTDSFYDVYVTRIASVGEHGAARDIRGRRGWSDARLRARERD
jgi:hypothetical protein